MCHCCCVHCTKRSCSACLQNVAANGLSEKVSVVHRDAALLERGRDVRRLGANIVVVDMFDAGLTTMPAAL